MLGKGLLEFILMGTGSNNYNLPLFLLLRKRELEQGMGEKRSEVYKFLIHTANNCYLPGAGGELEPDTLLPALETTAQQPRHRICK